jgi:CRP-like cAMP-binding protein
VEGQVPHEVNFITRGKLGVEFRIPNIAYGPKEIILDTLGIGDVFGWSGLLKENPWSTLKAIEPTDVIYVSVDDLLKLFNDNNHIGLIVIKNLAGIITSGLRRTRQATLNAIVAIKG